MIITRLLAAASLISVCLAQPAFAQLRADLVVGGLSAPVGFVQDPSQPNVQVVVEQGGRVRVIQNGVLLAQDFLDLTTQVVSGGEQGLLGLAFAPDYATSRRVYVNFTNTAGDTVVARFLRDPANPLRADPATRFDLVWPGGLPFIDQPFANHNGGHLTFGPDGFLYIGLGDGGSGNDPFHNAQDPGTLLGKMLRIDVSVPAGHPNGYVVPGSNPFVAQAGVLPEIWSFGLRNPWRYNFDAGTGALIIADVGQSAWEEVNYEPAGRGGRNYGWRNREGAHDNVLTEPPFSLPLTDPIHEYSRADGQVITGGFVYRGSALGGAYVGRYFFADLGSNRVWSLALSLDAGGEASVVGLSEHTAELAPGSSSVSSFGVDSNGELYLVSYGRGEIYRIALQGAQTPFPCQTIQPGPTWICFNGDWLPPGFPIPGDPPPPPPPPTDPPPPPPPSSCPTVRPGPDWTCFSGNWLPPGFPIPDGSPTPPPPPPPPPPTDPIDPGPSSCPTIRPGSDWTCFNGNWLPPGFPIPDGTPAPPPPPPPPPPGSACTTVQPGSDWICFNGNWLPPGITGSCSLLIEPFVLAANTGIVTMTVPAAGGPVSLDTLADPPFSCPWSALSEVSWITVTSPAFPAIQRGDGSVQFTVQPNTTGVQRTGIVRVAERILTVIQSGQ